MEGTPVYSDLYVYLNIDGQWSISMMSFSAKSSRTLNLLSCDCGRHVDCGWPFFFECSGVILSLDVRLWCCMLIYILQSIIYFL